MGFFISLAIVALVGAIFSYVAWRVEQASSSPLFQWGGVGLWGVLLVIPWLQADIRTEADVFITVLGVAVSTLSWGPFIAHFVANRIFRLVRCLLSLDQIKVRPSYSLAEAATARKDLDKALHLYRRGAVAHPDDPEPHRRIAELFLKLHRPDDAIRAFREAQKREPDPEEQVLIVFAIAETVADSKSDPAAALRVLERFLEQHPGVKGKPYAEERIDILRRRLAGS